MAGEVQRLQDLRRFYDILADLERRLGGRRRLAECTARSGWPRRGVYFFVEPGELRSNSGSGQRVVRVGTHALASRSSTTLWGRLSQHRGTTNPIGGNHRGSIFRLLIGTALMARGSGIQCDTWGQGSSAPGSVRTGERELEVQVSGVVGGMDVLWLAVDDPPSPESARGRIERGALALLSNYMRPALDPPSDGWLGRSSDRERVRGSGLWNSNHVEDPASAVFLDEFAAFVSTM